MKNRYYFIWIEGLSPRYGEKLLQFTNEGYSITTLMTHAMRFKAEHLPSVSAYLKRHGVSSWGYVPINYAPSGTLFNPDTTYIG
jgi:hypothetical protein